MVSNLRGTLKALAKLTPILEAQYILGEYIFVEGLGSLEQRLEHLVYDRPLLLLRWCQKVSEFKGGMIHGTAQSDVAFCFGVIFLGQFWG